MKNIVHLTDCMEFMKTVPDKYYELAIVDPPYGIGNRLTDGGHKKNPMEKYRQSYEQKRWDVCPDGKYFDELFRISKNQIIWGGNYFINDLYSSRCFLIWDKKQMMPTFSRCEMAWTSFDKPSKIFEQPSGDSGRFHPTQKPVALYKWLLQNYAKPGDKIFDSHVGSGSSRIACHDLGFDFEGCELDADYWKAQEERYQNHISQQSLFDTSEIQELIYK